MDERAEYANPKIGLGKPEYAFWIYSRKIASYSSNIRNL